MEPIATTCLSGAAALSVHRLARFPTRQKGRLQTPQNANHLSCAHLSARSLLSENTVGLYFLHFGVREERVSTIPESSFPKKKTDLLHVSRLIFCLSINRCSGPSVRRLASLVDSRVIVKSGPHLFVWCTSCVVMWYIGCPFPFPFTFSFRLPPTRWRTRKLPRGAAAPEVQGVGAGVMPSTVAHLRSLPYL
ncbi:hypothetical protein PVAP13_9KG618600 [Panicum virgatum]|uniref:Uncharacterized protein n=1 Tax=Panicum virgatum TaxID=38727 RepID=A0A8T0P336_PANVG|nr:hypothetical protein PVAP13_9KG618600 [Panicum virgatum]